MLKAAPLAARLVIALGLLLNGLGPAMADMGAAQAGSMPANMTMMPGMQKDTGQHRDSSGKDMPCAGMDCGCCIGGACAMPVMSQTEDDAGLVRPAGNADHGSDFLDGITFPPDIRPPISDATTA